jgi:hypothetical protein
MWHTSARGHRCSPVVAEEDEQDEAVPKGCSPEHQRRWRGDVTMAKSDGDLISAQERRRARERSRARGKGAGCSTGWSLPFYSGRGSVREVTTSGNR